MELKIARRLYKVPAPDEEQVKTLSDGVLRMIVPNPIGSRLEETEPALRAAKQCRVIGIFDRREVQC